MKKNLRTKTFNELLELKKILRDMVGTPQKGQYFLKQLIEP